MTCLFILVGYNETWLYFTVTSPHGSWDGYVSSGPLEMCCFNIRCRCCFKLERCRFEGIGGGLLAAEDRIICRENELLTFGSVQCQCL